MPHTATASTEIAATPDRVWETLTSPDAIRQFMFGAEASGDWTAGSTVTFRGNWNGAPYEDMGRITTADRPRHLVQPAVASEPERVEIARRDEMLSSFLGSPQRRRALRLTIPKLRHRIVNGGRLGEPQRRLACQPCFLRPYAGSKKRDPPRLLFLRQPGTEAGCKRGTVLEVDGHGAQDNAGA